MEVDDAIKNMKMFHFKNLPRFKPELIELLKSLQAENKRLKKENKAYKGIVEEIENDFGNGILQNENGFGVKLEHLVEIKKQKYLGGENK